MGWVIVCVFVSTSGPIAAFLLPLADLLARLDGGAFGLKPRLPHRARLPDPAPLPDDRPGAEQRPGHGDGVEPQPVTGGFAPLQVDRGHRPVLGVLRKYDFTDNRIYDD